MDFNLICSYSHYLAELVEEHRKLGPFVQVLPVCSRLLNQGLLYFLILLCIGFFILSCSLCCAFLIYIVIHNLQFNAGLIIIIDAQLHGL